jgi:HPt (histidine-containing phosphotransfer) domain-containing protein
VNEGAIALSQVNARLQQALREASESREQLREADDSCKALKLQVPYQTIHCLYTSYAHDACRSVKSKYSHRSVHYRLV